MKNQLVRSDTKRVIAGICGGLGEFLRIDPLIIRIFFILWTILGEFSVLIYFILWVVIPDKSSADSGESWQPEQFGARFRQIGYEIRNITRNPSQEAIIYAGVSLMGWGAFQLLRAFGFRWLDWNISGYMWPALLVVAGAFILIRTATHKQ